MQEIRGDAAKKLIISQIEKHRDGILSALAPFEPIDTFHKWHTTIRSVEELINVSTFGIDDPKFISDLRSVPLDMQLVNNPTLLRPIQVELSKLFNPKLAQRFTILALQTAAINIAFQVNGQSEFGYGLNLRTVGASIDYFQSRRGHLVSLLYSIPNACKGNETLNSMDTLNVLLPLVEHSCVTLTSLHQQAALTNIFPDFCLHSDGADFQASHQFQPLENYFLEPERASIYDMYELRQEQVHLPTMEDVAPEKIFSAAELRNSIRLIEATYKSFALNDTDFSILAKLVVAFSRNCSDDYIVKIENGKFLSFLAAQTQIAPEKLETLLVNRHSDYESNTNAHHPFINLGSEVISNVNLLSRFLYNFKNFQLGSRRRFQIHSGFIFEDMVKRDLAGMGFQVTDIKRINRKEFDVVTVYKGKIYNFQCKNNYVDLRQVNMNQKKFVRYNRHLASYYERALVKEKNREGLILTKLELPKISHFVISRFPIFTQNPNIFSYNRLSSSAAQIKAGHHTR
jgi:hypothetical protein